MTFISSITIDWWLIWHILDIPAAFPHLLSCIFLYHSLVDFVLISCHPWIIWGCCIKCDCIWNPLTLWMGNLPLVFVVAMALKSPHLQTTIFPPLAVSPLWLTLSLCNKQKERETPSFLLLLHCLYYKLHASHCRHMLSWSPLPLKMQWIERMRMATSMTRIHSQRSNMGSRIFIASGQRCKWRCSVCLSMAFTDSELEGTIDVVVGNLKITNIKNSTQHKKEIAKPKAP